MTFLVIELDGPVHENQVEYDLERDRVLQGLSLRVLRGGSFKSPYCRNGAAWRGCFPPQAG